MLILCTFTLFIVYIDPIGLICFVKIVEKEIDRSVREQQKLDAAKRRYFAQIVSLSLQIFGNREKE